MDKGTLYQLRNLINRRNVVTDVTKDLTACEDFFILVVEGHILSAAMTMFKMENIDDNPPEEVFQSTGKPSDQFDSIVCMCRKLIDKYVNISFGDNSGTSTETDGVESYACELLTLGMLYLEFVDSIREGAMLQIFYALL